MATVSEELESFYQFAELRLRAGADSESLDELYAEWRARNRSVEVFESDVRAVRAALRDMENGETGRPVEEFTAEFRLRNGI